MVERFPDNVFALTRLGTACLQDDRNPIQGRDCLLRALHLQPLDEDLKRSVWSAHLATARVLAGAENWDLGRQSIAAAEAIDSANEQLLETVARKAVFELSAGKKDKSRLPIAEEFIRQALSMPPAPVSALLLLSAESARYGLSRTLTRRFVQDWNEAIKGVGTSAGLGSLCRLLSQYIESDVNYTGHAKQVTDLVKSIKRSQKIAFAQQDLEEVCRFLFLAEERKLFETMVKKGGKAFPSSAYLQLKMGDVEFDRGPRKCNCARAIKSYEAALRLSEKKDDARSKQIAERARSQLTFLNDHEPAPMPDFLDFASPGGTKKSPRDMIDSLRNMMDELGIDPSMLANHMPQELLDLLAAEMSGGADTKKGKPKPK
jgi:hypothetical protein